MSMVLMKPYKSLSKCLAIAIISINVGTNLSLAQSLENGTGGGGI